MADDLGYGELGSYGQKVIKTPQLDRMAREGMRFTHFYAGATVCAPSRSVLMTGQHQGRTPVRGNAALQNPRAQALRAEDVTVARALKDVGYSTALIGKWGLGDLGEAESGLPRKHGFLYWEYGLNRQAVLYQGRWKGLRIGVHGPLALHDLQNDVAEKNNVAAQHPDIVGKIETYLKTARTEGIWDYGTQNAAGAKQAEALRAAGVAAWHAKIPARLRARMNETTMGAALAYVEDNPRLPRVLLIGDSISIGYTGDVREALRGEANVHRVPDNSASTRHGLASIEAWLGTGRWDVIHFNWGLHDLVMKPDGQHAVPPEQYRINLNALIERMKKTGAALIFATTTAVPEGERGRRAGSEGLYNPVAVEVMKSHDVTINDLDAAIRPHLLEYQVKNDVHFEPPGAQFLAGKVTDAIQRALASRGAAAR